MLCGFFFNAAHAENPFRYDVETTLSYGRIGGVLTVFEIEVQRYFETVNTQSRPHAEAAFLQHASSADVAVRSTGINSGNFSGNELGFDARIRYVLDALPLVVSAKVGAAARQLDNSDVNLNTSVFGVGAGAYVTQGTYLGAEFSQTDQTLSSASYRARENASFTTAGINVKSVFEIADERAFAVTASGTKTKFDADSSSDSNALDLGLDFYVDRATSIGIETVDKHRAGGSDLRLRNITLRWFVVPEASVKFELGQLTDNDPAFSTAQKHQAYALHLSVRL